MKTPAPMKTPRKRPHALPKDAPLPTLDDPTAGGNLCGSRRKQAQLDAEIAAGERDPWPFCTARAGWKTDHPRAGRCHLHAGSSPSGKAAARLQLAELVPAAILTLGRTMTDPDAPAHAKVRASEAVLNRAGYPAKLEVDIEGARETLYERIQRAQREQAAQS